MKKLMVCPRWSAKEGLFGRIANSGRLPPALSLGQGLPSSTCRSSLQPGGPSEAQGSTPALSGLARCVLCDDISTYVCVHAYLCTYVHPQPLIYVSLRAVICYAAQCMHVCMYACMCVCCMHQHVVQQVGSAKVASGCLGMNSRMFPQRTPRLLLRMTPQAASETTCRMLPQTTLQTFLRMNPGTAPQMTPWMIPWSTPRTTPRRTRWKIPWAPPLKISWMTLLAC